MPLLEDFHFSTLQKKGVWLILFSMFTYLGLGYLYTTNREQKKSLPPYKIMLASQPGKKFHKEDYSAKIPFILKVNTAGPSDFKRLPGIGEVLSQRIVKYRESIGGFEQLDDLRKVYGIEEKVFKSILPYLTIESKKVSVFKRIPLEKPNLSSTPDFQIEINTATASGLARLPGIGKILSARIVKYRNFLGGFATKEELKKVYGLSAEVFEKISGHIYIDTALSRRDLSNFYKDTIKTDSLGESKLIKIDEDNLYSKDTVDGQHAIIPLDINLAGVEELKSLPGIGAKTAQRIARFRKLLGYFYDIDQLKDVYGFTPKNYEKASAYLFINPKFTPSKSDLNTASVKSLKRFPFISDKLAMETIVLRKKLGWYSNWEELLTLPGIDKVVIFKMKQYFYL